MTTLPAEAPASRPAPRWPGPLSKAVAVLSFCVIVAGSLVTSTRSGDADPAWPLFGDKIFPSPARMSEDRGLFFEWGHRTVAWSLGLLTLVLAFGLRKAHEPRRWVRALGIAAAAGVALLGALGGLRVRWSTISWLGIVHVGVAMLFLSLATALAVFLGKRWFEAPSDLASGRGISLEDVSWLATGSVFCAISIYAQSVLGAVPRHLDVWTIPHIIWAFGVFTCVVLVASRALSRHSHLPGLLRPAMALLVLVVLQFFLGFTTYVVRPEGQKTPGTGFYELMASLHQAAGALMMAASVVLAIRALQYRRLLQEGATGARSVEGVA